MLWILVALWAICAIGTVIAVIVETCYDDDALEIALYMPFFLAVGIIFGPLFFPTYVIVKLVRGD